MKVLVISAVLPPHSTGEATNTLHLVNRLAASGVETHLLTTRRPDALLPSGVVVHQSMVRWNWREWSRLRSFLRSSRPDAVYLMYLGGIYDYHPMITYVATLARRVLPGIPIITRFEHPEVNATPGTKGLGVRAIRKVAALWAGSGGDYAVGTLIRDSDAIITLCEHHLRLLRRIDPSVDAKAHIIPPPTNIEVFPDVDGGLRAIGRGEVSAKADTFLLGFLGYVYPGKGFETLLDAIAMLRHDGRDVRLSVLGGKIGIPGDDRWEGYYDRMLQRAHSLGLKDAVTWFGAFTNADRQVAARIHAVDTFVFPFDSGIRLNNSSVSAVASYGIPVVSTVTEESDRAFRHGDNTYLCAPRDPAALAAAIRDVMLNPALRARLRAGGLELATNSFSWTHALEKTHLLLNGRRHAS